ncbi:MAG: DUF2817 domain-containing protein [Limnobacter sp.]|nr:DUF2817 domain-containing protein [Limnobacter sp.]
MTTLPAASVDPGSAGPASHFQPSYRVSRERLLEKLHALSARHPVLVDSRAIGPRGPHGETLALDFCIVGARRPKRALVLSSGTHGVEGYTGSALQHWVLDVLLPGLRLADDCALVLQHANNPYGFAWHRRVDEDNVDLNRNFLDDFDPSRCPPDYEALYECLNPVDLDPANEARRWARIADYIARHGQRQFQQVAVEGQYKFPQGIQFGGQRRGASARHLLALVGEHLRDAESVVWLDIHTGLGESGSCELITGAAPDTPAFARAQQAWGGQVHSSYSGDSVSTPVNGLLDLGLAQALPPGCRFAFAYAEYGTWPPERVLRAMRADNWLHHHGDRGDATGRAIESEMLEAFRPAAPDWAGAVVAHGASLVESSVEAANITDRRCGKRASERSRR